MENKPLLFIESPVLIKKAKKNIIINGKTEYQNLFNDLDQLNEKGINTICLAKLKDIQIEDFYLKQTDDSIKLGKEIIKKEDIKEFNIIKFEKK